MKVTIVHMEIELLLGHGFQFANCFPNHSNHHRNPYNSRMFTEIHRKFYHLFLQKSHEIPSSTMFYQFLCVFFHIFPPTQSCQAVGYFNFTVWGLFLFSPMCLTRGHHQKNGGNV